MPSTDRLLADRPPRLVGISILLVVLLLGAGAAWAAIARVEQVVTAPGQVRPLDPANSASSAAVSRTGAGGRVIEVDFQVGREVRRGDVLLRLDPRRLDNAITRETRLVEAGSQEVDRLARLRDLVDKRYAATRAQGERRLRAASQASRRAKRRHDADVRLARLGLQRARVEETRTRRLVTRGLSPRADLEAAVATRQACQTRLTRALIPVDQQKVELARQALAVLKREHQLEREERAVQLARKQALVEAAQRSLEDLRLQREQCVVRAPIDGVVTSGRVRVGDLVEQGEEVAVIAPQRGLVMTTQVPASAVAQVRAGMPARVRLAAFDTRRYGLATGEVVFVAPDAHSDAGGEAVYEVQVLLDSDRVGDGEVRLGMTGTVEIVTGRDRFLTMVR